MPLYLIALLVDEEVIVMMFRQSPMLFSAPCVNT